ncbi:hypothetical protein JG688_00003006 [Phytophthora aleatoria]|uniref:Vacuolar protein sorting-associated protein n=1 Tax=Phytophthora aleatoria TaxID=2496075 RepID=A0A8J5MIG7_9STRA|nr:hypothetical protein JG688_00003006 [Phytophthora aleatoria]
MFLQRYVHVVLDAILGSYVKNIDPAALQISVWNGKIEVEAVELQPDAFSLPKQMRLVKGTLRQLRIDLPWTNLGNQPIRVDIQDVSLLLEVCADDRAASDSDQTPEKQRRQKLQTLQRKRAALDAMEKALEFNEKNKTQTPPGQSWTQSFLFKLMVKVLDNVQVHVQHLHLRMEDAVSDPSRPYAVGMTLEAIIIKSADEGWNYTMVGRGQQVQDGASFIRKKMDINKFGIYWSLPLVPVPAAVLSDAEAFATLMRSNFSIGKKLEELEPSPSPPTSESVETVKTTSPPLFKPSDYIVHPLTVSMKLTVNDGNAKLPITHQELSERVLSRLGTPWMVETIDAIGDGAWREFLEMMPKLAGERKYTLGFVFSEAWSVARDLTEEEDEIPSVRQFKEALSSCMQWSLEEVDRVEPCIVKYREAVVHVMEEKSTYIDAQASIDQISTSLHRQQYLSALSFISFVTVKRRQARYLVLRPKRIRVKDNPRTWWRYAINAVLLDVRERLAHVDWEALERARQRRNRYKELYLVLEHGTTFAATLVSSDLRLLTKEMARSELDELDFMMDVQELMKLRRAVRKDIAKKETEKEVLKKLQSQRGSEEDMPQGSEVPASSRLWSYATWLTGAGGAAQGHDNGSRRGGEMRVEDVKWSDQDTKDLYEAIDFHPEEDDKESRSSESGEFEDAAARKKRLLQEHQHILYRFQLTLCKASFGLSLEDAPTDLSGLTLHEGVGKAIPTKSTSSSQLIASLDDVEIQFLVRPSCVEVGLQLRDALFCQSSRLSVHDNLLRKRRSASSSGTDFFLQRMDMDEILEYHPVGVRNQMSSVRLRHCERELPLMQLSIESERQPKLVEECDTKRETSTEDAAAANLLRVTFVTQPIKCNVNLMFLLDVVAVFSRPVNVDLSGLEHSAWRRAQSLQRYSTAQLRDALTRRTKVEMRLDVISPLINIIQSPPSDTGIPTGEEVSLLVFLGHLKAQTKHPSDNFDEADISSDFEEKETVASRTVAVASPEESLYDVLEINISGIEVQIIDGGAKNVFRVGTISSKKSAWHYLLEKTSLTFSFYMSVTPDDPSIPLLKLFGGVDSVNLNLSATSFRSLMQLLHSFGDNFSVHAQRRIERDAATVVDKASLPSTRIGPLTTGTPQRSKPKLVRKTSSYVKPGAVALSSSGSSGRPAASENSPYLGLARKIQLERKKTLREKDIDDQDLLKLWKRVLCQLQFGVGEIILTLQVRDIENGSGKIVRVRAVDINTRLKVRSYDKRLEFALGTFLVEDILLSRPSPSLEVVEKKRFLVKSGNHGVVTDLGDESEGEDAPFAKPPPSSEQLIHVAITSIASDAVLLKDKKLWKHARHSPLSPSSDENSVWQDPLIPSLSVDASLRVLTIDVYQDTLAEVFVFFFQHKIEDTEGSSQEQSPPPPPPSLRSISEGSTGKKGDMEEQSVLSSVDAEANERTFSRKLSGWVASSFLDNLPGASPETEKDLDDSTTSDVNDGVEEELPASMQLRLHVQGLSLFLHLDDKQRPEGMPSAFASLTAQQFCCCVQRFPRYLSMFAYLTSLKICDVSLPDHHLSEIISHGSTAPEPKEDEMWINRDDTREYDGGIAVGHVPALSEILIMLDDVPAVFSCAAQFYGADSIQEAWHPGYSSRYSVRLKSPRIRFLYSFVDDMRNYWMKGVLLETVLSILSQEQADMLWEGDFQLADIQGGPTQAQRNEEKEENGEDEAPSGEFLGSDVVSMFPLVDIRLEDTVLEMPPHRMSSESLLLRFDSFRVSNEGVVNSFLGMENRIVAKVLLNSSLKQLQLDMKALRIVSVILVDRNDVAKRLEGGGFITQSLLGLTNYSLSEQYAFVLRVPFQNYRRADYNLANGRLTADVDLEGIHIRDSRVNSKMSASYRDVVVFERYMEGLPKAIKIQFGRESFDVDVSTIGFDPAFTSHGNGLRTPRTQFRNSEMSAYSPMSSTVTSHGAHSEKSSKEKTPPVVGTEGRMDLVIDIAGFKVIPSNIHYDLIQFLTIPPGLSGDAEGYENIRGRLEDKFTALTSLRFGIQAYNSQLAVWEPVLEDFEVSMAYHGKGGVLCDYCMSERQSVSPTGAALRCDGMPLCLFRSSRTEVFTNAAAHSWESKNFIYRELLEQPDVQDGAKLANTFMIVVKDDFNINVSRNVINVLVHFFALVTKVTAADEALSSRLGPFIYVDNQSGIPFVVATHPSSSSGAPPTAGGTPSSSRRPTSSIEMPTEVPGADTNDDIMKTGTAMFNSNAWSRRRLTTMLNDISSSDTKWIRVESGERVATEIVAHEAPAGCVTSPLRRLLWLKPQSPSQRPTSSKAIPVPIGYSNRSYLHLESSGKQRDSWHGESIICETVAEQGTLVLRLRGKIQLTNFFSVPIQVIYNDQREETIEPGGKAAHYIPIQYLESGTIAFRPLLSNGKVQHSEPLLIASILRSNDNKVRGRSNRRQNVGSLELRKALTFYWDVHPSSGGEDVPDFTFGVSLPPFQVILTALRKSERHETTITLRPPIVLENLVPYELSYRTVCMKSEAEVVWVAKNAASFSGVNGKVSSGSSACVAELDVLERDMESGEIVQTPTVVGLSLALPQIQLGRFSRWSRDTFIYGCQSFCERIELNMRDDSELEVPTPANKLTICVEITQLEKLRSRALNTLCPVVCRVFTEYWLIDRTSLSLAFYTADDYLIPSNHPGRLYDDKGDAENESSSVSLSVFSCESKQVVSKMKIGIKGGKGEREVQSEPFDISAVGVRGQILVPTNRSRDARSLLSTIAEFGAPSDGLKTSFKQYEFGVMIEQGPEKFSRSRVVTLVPRYYFINTSNRFEIRIRQERSADPSAVIVLRPQETKIFHWSDSRLPSRVQICFVLPDNRQNERDTVSYANSSQWSAPFELSSVGNFVLRVKSKVRPAPPCLPECFEGNVAKREQVEDDEATHLFFDEEDEYSDAERMLAEGIQLNVAVELHDPSFLVYLEEGEQSVQSSPLSSYAYEEDDREHTLTVKHKENEGFVPFKIKNECSNLALVVWQKTLVKDDKGNVTIGFEGGEPVLPFHTIDYVPFRFSAFPTVFVQVQKVAGLGIGALRKEHPLHGNRSNTLNSKTPADRKDKEAPVTALTRAATVGQTQVVASFEVQLKKLQRLPTIDVSEGVVKKRLWAEVLLDETTKTLLVTDMLPGFSGEHKRRRRATLLRSWKRYNTSIVFISHVLAAHRAKLTDGCDEVNVQDVPAKKKRVRFAADVAEVKRNSGTDEDETAEADQQGTEAGSSPPSIEEEKEVEALVLCVRLVDATYLEDVFLQAGRSDLTSCQPFITFSLKTDGEEARTKLTPQSTTMFPRWLPASNSRAALSALMLSDGGEESSSHEFGAGAEIIVEIREADKILFGSSVIATARIPLQEYCAAAMISARSGANHELQVVEFLAPVRVARKGGGWSRPVENGARIRFQMCCRRTLTTRSAAAESSGEGRDTLDTVKELKDILSAYNMKKELDVLVSSKSQLKLLLEREAVDTSTSGTNIPAALRPVPDASSGEEKKDSGLSRFVARSPDADDDSLGSRSRSSNSVRGSAVSATTDESLSDGTYEEMGDEKRLSAVLIGVSNLQIPTEIIRNNFKHTHGTTELLEPKVYCTITYQESTRSALSAVAKSSTASVATASQNNSDESGSSSPGRSSVTGPPGSNAHLQQVRTHEFPRGQMLGLDLVYRNGRVLVQGVVCDGPCGALVYEGKIRIGDTVVAANNKSIVNLHRDASFAVIEKAMHWGEGVGASTPEQASATFTLSFLYQPTTPERMAFSDSSRPPCAQATDEDTGMRKYDAEWNRRVEFVETANKKPVAGPGEEQVLVRVYLRNETSDHGLSASQESSIVPFLYFFGDDAIMDHLDHSKQDSRFDVLLAECWVPLPPSSLSSAANPMSMDGNPMTEPSALTFNERICALYSPQQRSHQHSALEMIGQLRLALKWDFINPLRAAHQQGDLSLHFQLEVARICISVVDDGAWSSVASAAGPQQPQEVLCISLSDQNASAGVQLSYGQITDGKQVVNARIGHFQIDNQLLDTNYPVLLRPMRLLDAQMQEEGFTMAREKGGKDNSGDGDVDSPMLLPTVQLMAVFSRQPNVIQFDYIFGQLQELEIKLEDATLVALAHVFSGVEWSHTASNTRTNKKKKRPGDEFGSNLALKLLEIEWSTPTLLSTAAGGRLGSSRNGGGANMKVLLRWLLLCPVKVNVTFTSTADRSLLLSLLSPDMSSVLSTLISAAAALVSNLDQAPIRVPEFYVENLLETTHTLAFYAMQHYLHHGLRSWYSIMGSVDFLGNPIGLVSTLGTGVKDFFYTPAQMLLEDENGLRIDNLRTGMTKGSKSLLRNTAVGIFHTTGKITETLGKGIALLAMDEQYNVQRQRASTRQIKKINDLGDAIAEGSKGLVGGVWDGIKGVVAAPVRGAEQDGAGGFVVGIGKGVAGLIVKPTAGFLDLLTSLSRGAKTSAESLDGTDRNAFDTVTRFRLPRRICSDGVLVSYSDREARGYAVLLLTSLDATDDYVYHVDYGIEPHRGLLLLTDKRLICLSGKTGQKLWEVALDSTLEIVVEGATLKIGQTTSPSRSYNIECDNEVAATNFRVAVDSARVDVSATRYLLLNLEKSQEESRIIGGGRFGSGAAGLMTNDEDRTDLHVLMESVQDTTVSGLSNDDLRSQPLRSVRVEVCHLQNKDAHANVPNRTVDKLLSFSVFQIQVYGGPYQWTVFRRFSEFRELCAKLEAAGYVLDGLPPLPPRTFLPSTRAPVAKYRQEALNMFLQAAIMHSAISRSAAMLDFLTREAREVRVSLPPLSPTGEREASQRAGDSP